MLLSRIEVISGTYSGVALEPKRPIVTVGRSGDNDLALPLAEVGEHHFSIRIGVDEVLLETGLVGWYTAVLRGKTTLALAERTQQLALKPDDIIEIGKVPDGDPIRIALYFAPEDAFEPQVVATRPIGHWEPPSSGDRFSEAMAILNEAERAILSATGLDQVYTAVLDATLRVIPRATHATLRCSLHA